MSQIRGGGDIRTIYEAELTMDGVTRGPNIMSIVKNDLRALALFNIVMSL